MAHSTSGKDGHDAALPFFTTSQAARFRRLVREDFERTGRPVTAWSDDHATCPDGSEIGFWNLAADCRMYPAHEWPKIIREHFAQIDGINPETLLDGITRTKALRKVYLKLWSTRELQRSWYPEAREIAPGILEVLTLHHRRAAIPLRPQDIERFGGEEILRKAARGNLADLRVEGRELVETPEGGSFRILSGHSSFTASRILTLERLVTDLFLEARMPYGVLAAIPNRHEVAVHIIQDDSAIPTLVNLTTFALVREGKCPGPISPAVFWVTPDRFERVAGPDRDGMIAFTMSPDFQDTLGRVGAARV